MELGSLKEVLLRKSVGNKNLSTLIEYIGDEILISHVMESLEKMARPTSNTGRKVNAAVSGYAANLDRSDVAQLRDAMSHHVSHYKAALKAMHSHPEGSPERVKMRSVADQHLNHLVPLMSLAAKAGAHSNGKLGLDYVGLPAWETNYTTLDRRPETGKFIHDNKKLGRRIAPGARQWSPENPNARGVKDYHYLEMPPHPGHEDFATMPHEGGYPWEEVQIGSDPDIDAKKAYLHIQDVPDKKEYTPHPFDSHPVYSLQDTQDEHLSPERLHQFAADLAGWKTSPHHKEWIESQRAAHQADPEGYKARGTVKPSHVYEGIPLQEQLGHIHQHPRREKRLGGADVQAQLAALKAKAAAAKPSIQPMVRKPGSVPAPTPTAAPVTPKPTQASKQDLMENAYQMYLNAPAALQEKLFHTNPEFMEYLKTKKGSQ